MTSSDVQVDLIINKLTKAQFNQLSAQSLIDENQLYMITDDKPIDDVISSYLSSYYNKTQIDTMIGNIENLLAAING